MEDEATRLFEQNGALIRAAEDWAPEYKKDPATFGQLLALEARLERLFYGYFKDLAERAPNYVDWLHYETKRRQLHAADQLEVEVIVTEVPDAENENLLRIFYDPATAIVTVGLEAGEALYKIPLGPSEVNTAIERAAAEEVAQLIGRRVDKYGNIVDNPNAKYRISETSRDIIRSSIRKSLLLGEDQTAATERLRGVIRDRKRAAKIASTEAVNGYQRGMFHYALSTGAIGKEWQGLITACPICQTNMAAGVVDINGTFPSGHKAPSAHPWDRCSLRYIYPEELLP